MKLTYLEMVEKLFELRKSRYEHPEGYFDKQGRWYPDINEKCECCDYIRTPSKNFPYSLMIHCRTKKHIKNLLTKKLEN